MDGFRKVLMPLKESSTPVDVPSPNKAIPIMLFMSVAVPVVAAVLNAIPSLLEHVIRHLGEEMENAIKDVTAKVGSSSDKIGK